MKYELVDVQSHSKVILDRCTACDSHQMASCMQVAARMVLCVCGRTQSDVHTACGNAFNLTMCRPQLLSITVEITSSSRLKFNQSFHLQFPTLLLPVNAENRSFLLKPFHVVLFICNTFLCRKYLLFML